MARSEHNAALFGVADAATRAAKCAAGTLAHLHKHQRAVALGHDQVDFAATAPRRPIIALQQAQARRLQMRQGLVFCGVSGLFGGGGPGRYTRLFFPKEFHVSSSAGITVTLGLPMSTSFTLALQAARETSASQHYPQGALYVVATPIGNLADISLRALHVLQLVDVVACEDTRHTQALLRAFGIDRPTAQLLAVHQHNESESAQRVIERLQQGQRVAYASDAGTPGVSDPGARLVAAVRAAGLPVVPLPGASSITAAVSVAGLVAQGADDGGFVFAGFLPTKAGERAAAVQTFAAQPRAVVLLEAPHRVEDLARALAPLGTRAVTVGRELTKQFEEIATLPAQNLPAWLAAQPNRTRGEFVLVIHAAPPAATADTGTRVLQLLLPELPVKTAVRIAAELTGQPRNALYDTALQLKREMDAASGAEAEESAD